MKNYIERIKTQLTVSDIFANASNSLNKFSKNHQEEKKYTITCNTCGAPRLEEDQYEACYYCGTPLFEKDVY